MFERIEDSRTTADQESAHTPSSLQEAERELAAFHKAVLKMHGPEEAQRAADDWIRELEATDANEAPANWRRISVAAAGRLASRLVNSSSPNYERKQVCCAIVFEDSTICRSSRQGSQSLHRRAGCHR